MFLSIVIPTYNRASFLPLTIQSLLDQYNDDFEIIVVDDGSTDNTEEVVNAITDKRIRYFKKKNEERGAARNFGARLAGGEYLNFFDSDDVAYPNHVKTAMEKVIELDRPEVFHLGYDVKDPAGKVIRLVKAWPYTINATLIDGNHLSCNGVIVRRDIALAFPFNESRSLSASEDYELWLRLAARYNVYCISTITSTVINHDARSVILIRQEKLLERMMLLESELLNDKAFVSYYGDHIRTFRAYMNIYIALHLGMAKYPKAQSTRFLLSALWLQPKTIFTRRFFGALKNILY